MAYTTKALVRSATGFSNTTNITDTTIDAYIADADSVIDAKIADVYTLPLSETPQIIETISRHITIALLYSNEYGEESQNTDKGWKNRMKWAMDVLEDIRLQKTKLRGTDGTELARSSLRSPSFYPTEASSDPSATNTTEPQITMDKEF